MRGRYLRYVEILRLLLPFAVAFLRDRRRFLLFGRSRSLPEEDHRDRAHRLTETLLQLGPAFIKAGQVLSTRPDLVPPVYTEALDTLQDEVPESEEANPVEVVQSDLGADVLDLDTLESVAGGSLAYVYRAQRADTAEEVAVKVRRPNVRAEIERDLHIIRHLVPLVSAFAPERHRYSLQNIADDFEEIILEELDFEREAEMMEQIRANLADDDRVYVPWADTDVSTERVLVMEYVEGVKITDDAVDGHSVTREELAATIADVYLRMGLGDGVFHADPHPGNLAVSDDGRLVIYDFGMCEELSPAVRAQIVDLYVSLSRRDVDGLVEALVALDVLEPGVDRRRVRRVLELAIETLAGKPHVTWHDIFSELLVSLQDFPFRIPPDVMLLLRVGSVGEGVCRSLDPEFDFLDAVQSHLVDEGHARRELRKEVDELREELLRSVPVAAGLPRRLDTVLRQVERGDVVVRTERTAERSRDRTGYAVLSAGLFITAGVLYPYTLTGTALATGAALLSLVLFQRG